MYVYFKNLRKSQFRFVWLFSNALHHKVNKCKRLNVFAKIRYTKIEDIKIGSIHARLSKAKLERESAPQTAGAAKNITEQM